MTTAAALLLALAGILHVYIFALESVLWTRETTRRTFGVRTLEEAETTRPLAFNQGFYNLFLAVIALAGTVSLLTDHRTVGVTLAFCGAGSMLAAALVLVLSDRTKARAASTQGTIPLLALLALALS